MSFSTLAALALKVGPMAIRGITSLFGGNNTANKVADIVEQADQMLMPTEQKLTLIETELIRLPPEIQVELKQLQSELEKEHNRRIELEFEDLQKAHQETQQTIRQGDRASDAYVRRTRPKMARQSWYATVLYVIGFEAAQAMNHGTGADLDLAMVLSAPAWAYLGLRTMDKTGVLDRVKTGFKGSLNLLRGKQV